MLSNEVNQQALFEKMSCRCFQTINLMNLELRVIKSNEQTLV